MAEKILLRHGTCPDLRRLDVYDSDGGYEAARKALTEHQPEQLIEMVKASNLRGRGGAGFPTGMKWGFLPKDRPRSRVYLCVNADESEPGTFKDRADHRGRSAPAARGHHHLGLRDPAATPPTSTSAASSRSAPSVLETRDRRGVRAGATSARTSSAPASTSTSYVHRGAGAYICGEETGLIESLEGKRAYPRIKPPFPATHGALRLPDDRQQRRDARLRAARSSRAAPSGSRAIGPEKSPGPKLFCVSGHVERPGVYELPMGTPLREIIYEHAGGIPNGKQLKARHPRRLVDAGASRPPRSTSRWTSTRSPKAGSLLGSAGIIVMDDDTCMVRALHDHRALLPPRVVRPVHAVPRGHRLARRRVLTRPRGGRRARAATSTCC